ncbi:MAG: M28 family peptidase [Candidatus Bathyarchaeia archaeon]
MRRPRVFFVLAAMLVIQAFLQLPAAATLVRAQSQLPSFGDGLDLMEFAQHVNRLSTMPTSDAPSRFTGYPGFYQAAEYINETLSSYGYRTEFEYFDITVPVDEGASVVVTDGGREVLRLRAYPLVPNTVQTSSLPQPVTGGLVYGGMSTYEQLSGEEIDGKVVLLEYNSRWFWKNAANLGAKVIIFIEPQDTTRTESEFKYLKIPIHAPRLLIRRDDGLRLLDMLRSSPTLQATVTSHMRWENRRVANIVAVKEGEGSTYEQVVLAASYDSYSVVPSLAPGATDALNVAGLLELARYFSNQSVPRSIVFAFLAGHGQGLWGAREFVDRHFEEVGLSIKLFVNLDLSYESNVLAFYARGSVYTYTQYIESTSFGWISDRLEQYKSSIPRLLGKEYKVVNGMFVSEPIFEYAPLRFDSDPFTLAGGIGVAFHTTDSTRVRQTTSLDLPGYVNYENVAPQLEFVAAAVAMLVHEPTLPLPGSPTRVAADRGFAYVQGVLGKYNVTTAIYDPFPVNDSIVHVQWMQSIPSILLQLGIAAPPGSFDLIIKPAETYTKPDGSSYPNASFTVKGVKPYTTVKIEAYVLNESTSMIEYAMDFGVYGLGKGYPVAPGGANFWVNPEASTGVFLQWLPIFRCGSIAFYGVVDPASSARITFSALNYNIAAHSWNLRHSEDVFEGDAIVFVPPDTPTELILRYGAGAIGVATVMAATGEATRFSLAVLANMTAEKPEGSGYSVSAGEQIVIKNTALEIARQLNILTRNRREVTSSYHVYSAQTEQFLPLSEERLVMAEEAFREKRYDVAVAAAVASWAYGRSAYGASMSIIFDVINTVSFFFLLTIPFAFLLQKLLLPGQFGVRRLLAYVAVFLLVTGVLWLFHPGFHIASNVSMILISSTIGVFALVVAIRLFSTVSEAAEARRVSLLGLHFSGLSRSSALMMAISTGIENMKKRKFRTALTLVSLIIMTMALVMLTSGSFLTYIQVIKQKPPGGIPYNGLQLMDPNFAPQAEEMTIIMQGLFKLQNATVVPRTWLVTPGGLGFRLEKGVVVEGVLGLGPEEDSLLQVSQTLLEGRWFEEQDFTSCLLGSSLAKSLEKQVGDTVQWMGLNLTVMGIFDETAFGRLKDLNPAVVIAPVTFIESKPQPVPIESTLIVPYRLLVGQFNLYPYSISVRFEEPDMVLPEAYKLALQTVNFDVYAGVGDEVTVYSPRTWYGVSGITFMVIPFIIASLTILNVIIASVYQRTREIGIYGAVGLNPTHVAGLFLAESLLYAVISAIAGYIFSMAVLGLLDVLRAIPLGAGLNYASTFVLLVMALVMGTAIGSTVYPAIVAGRLVTPSFARRWKMPSSPVGDDWRIPLPFSGTMDDAGAQLMYLKEFADASTSTYGRFAAEKSAYTAPDADTKHVTFTARLAPFDLGVIQEVTITAYRQAPGSPGANLSMYIHRLAGHSVSWENLNRYFVDEIRKQLLMYRTLSPENKMIYLKRAQEYEKKQ